MATRSEVRTTISSLLETALTGVGNPVQAVYNHRKADFNGQSPVVIVGSGGTIYQPIVQGRFTPTYWVDVYVFVAYADAQGVDYDAEEVENIVDQVVEGVSAVILANPRHETAWKALRFDDRSRIEDAVIGGYKYWVEIIPLRAEQY